MDENSSSAIIPGATGGTNRIATTNITDAIIASMAGGVPYGDGVSLFAGRGVYIAKLTANESGGGKYTCSVYQVKNTLLTGTGNVTAADIEGTLIFANGIYLNLQEVGQSTHDLTHVDNTAQKYFLANLIGYTSDSTARPVFVGNAAWFDACA